VQIPDRLVGCQVYQVRFDYQTSLLLRRDNGATGPGVNAWLVIETPFTFQGSDGLPLELDPGTSRSALAPMIDLFLATVSCVSVEGRGTLTLEFTGGGKLTIAPDEAYESWSLSGEGVEGILVGPGAEPEWTR
jgi:hypothetical protein